MPIIQVAYEVPAEVAAGLATGIYKRFGSVVRDSNEIIMHLSEVGQTKEKTGSLIKGLFDGGAKTTGMIAIGIGVVAAVGGAAYYLSARKKRDSEPSEIETAERYNFTLEAYLEAITTGNLDLKTLKEFKTEIQALKISTASGEISFEYSHEWAQALNSLLADYTRKLAEANSADLSELPELSPDTIEMLLNDIHIYLDAQKRIFDSGV